MFTATFEEGKGDELLGGAPDPEHDNEDNIISVFINKVINPDNPFGSSVSTLFLSLSLSLSLYLLRRLVHVCVQYLCSKLHQNSAAVPCRQIYM